MKVHLTEDSPFPGEEFHDVEDSETYRKMLARDERRFRVADQDGDSMATREELTAFLHPEEFPHMRDIVVAVSKGQTPSADLGGSSHLVLQHLPQGTHATNTDPWRAMSPDPPVSLLVEGFIPTSTMPNFLQNIFKMLKKK